MTDIKTFTDAAKLDILSMLERSEMGIFEFRRIESIAKMMSPLCDSIGHPTEHAQLGITMRAAENVSKHLHDALAGRAFDAEALLRDKYDELGKHHRDLRHAALNIEEASAMVDNKRQQVEAQQQLLRAHEASLSRERERLQLAADAKGVELVLPPMPKLTSGDDDDEDEDEDDETGSEEQERATSSVTRDNY